MELAAWGALGEVIGALAVVLSVVYLANQMKDSARTASVQAHQNQTHASQIILQMMVSQPECWRRGHAAPETLSPEDLTRYHAMMYSYLLQLADLWHAARNSVFDPDTLDAWMRAVAALLNTSGGSSWWQEARPMFLPELVATIEASRRSVPAWTTIHPRQFADLATPGDEPDPWAAISMLAPLGDPTDPGGGDSRPPGSDRRTSSTPNIHRA